MTNKYYEFGIEVYSNELLAPLTLVSVGIHPFSVTPSQWNAIP